MCTAPSLFASSWGSHWAARGLVTCMCAKTLLAASMYARPVQCTHHVALDSVLEESAVLCTALAPGKVVPEGDVNVKMPLQHVAA